MPAFKSRSSNDPFFTDPWRNLICDRCPLPDCVRPEGSVFAGPHNDKYGRVTCKAIVDCPIYQAQLRGWGAEEAAERGDQLGLLEPVTWGEW